MTDTPAALLPERLGGVSFTPQGLAEQIDDALSDTTHWNYLANERDQPTPRPGTRFPADLLPTVPDDRWNAEQTTTTAEGPDGESSTTTFQIDAAAPREAEQRLLAWPSHEYADDLRDSTATATTETRPGRYTVTLRVPIRH